MRGIGDIRTDRIGSETSQTRDPGFLDGDAYKTTTYLAADLVWNPWKTVTLGGEYLWGRREVNDGASGTDSRFLLSSRFDF